jgi:hypothetical protein
MATVGGEDATGGTFGTANDLARRFGICLDWHDTEEISSFVRGEDTQGNPLPVLCGSGQRALPSARGTRRKSEDTGGTGEQPTTGRGKTADNDNQFTRRFAQLNVYANLLGVGGKTLTKSGRIHKAF